jgi:hypothetical protein
MKTAICFILFNLDSEFLKRVNRKLSNLLILCYNGLHNPLFQFAGTLLFAEKIRQIAAQFRTRLGHQNAFQT